MSPHTHVTVNAIAVAVGAPEVYVLSWTRACDRVRDLSDATFCVENVADGARPTCPECAVHLDAALEMAGR